MSDNSLVAVQFYDDEIGYENIWALPLGDGTYCLENPPFFVYDVSLNDLVAAAPDEDGALRFQSVVRRSGNSTLRARSDSLKDLTFRSKVEADLKEMGCVVEEHRERLLAISVPPTANLEKVTAYLTRMRLSWEHGYPSQSNT
jgi:Domain of unknown function (DUF4265)